MDEDHHLVILAKERLQEIIRLKRGKEDLEGRVEELKVLSRTHQAEIKKLEEESYIRDKRIEELKALAQKLEGENSYYRAHAEVTGKSLHNLQMENGELKTDKDELEERAKSLNQALNNYTLSCASCRKVTPVIDDEWVCKACHGTVKDHAHKAIDEKHGTIKFHDGIIDRILDILEPEFYDPTTPTAQSGYDYEAMFKGLGLMRAWALDEDLEEDLAEKVAGFIAHGMTDEEILDQVAEDDHIDLVALIRTLMEKK